MAFDLDLDFTIYYKVSIYIVFLTFILTISYHINNHVYDVFFIARECVKMFKLSAILSLFWPIIIIWMICVSLKHYYSL